MSGAVTDPRHEPQFVVCQCDQCLAKVILEGDYAEIVEGQLESWVRDREGRHVLVCPYCSPGRGGKLVKPE